MGLTNKQLELLNKLADRKANKMVLYMLMVDTKDWTDNEIDKLIQTASNPNASIADIIADLLKLKKEYINGSNQDYQEEEDEEEEEEEEIYGNNPFIFMFHDGSQSGLMKFEIGSKNADYFYSSLWDFNVCRLPKDIYDDQELEKCTEDWVYPSEWTIKNYTKLRSIDFSKYKAAIVWNDMTPNSLMFLYTVCKFVKGCDIYENNVSGFNMNPMVGLDEPNRDYTGILDGIRLITPELKEYFIGIYDRFAGKPVTPKIANGYEISEVSEDVIKERILSKCTNKYQLAIKIVLMAQNVSDPFDQDFISHNFYQKKVFEYTLAGLFDVKQHGTADPDYATEPCMFNGVDISNPRYYSIKLKK